MIIVSFAKQHYNVGFFAKFSHGCLANILQSGRISVFCALKNDFLTHITSYATIPSKDRIYPDTHMCRLEWQLRLSYSIVALPGHSI